jgi:membrane protease YdiL (CAAX protease family)
VLFLVGTALTAVRAVTRSIAASMLVHIGYNLTLFTMLFFASQHFHHFDRIS